MIAGISSANRHRNAHQTGLKYPAAPNSACETSAQALPPLPARSQTLPRALTVLCFLLILTLPRMVSADWKAFIPTPYENGAEVRAFASWERDDNRIGENKLNWEDTFLRQKFSFYSRGYSYHPKFIQYYLLLSGVFRQEKFSSSFLGPVGWTSGSGVEYNARFYVLPEHKYNVELFASRLEPLFKEHSAVQHDSVETSRGALFHYRDRPYFVNAKYIHDSIQSAALFSKINTLGAGGSYYKDFGFSKLFSLSANYNRPSFTNSEELEGTTNEFFLNGLIRNQWLSFSSNVSKSSFDQESPSTGSLDGDLFSLQELVTAYLPLNFRSDFEYGHRKNTNTIANPGEPAVLRSSTRKDIQASLSHRLYQSLDSRYSIRRDTTNSNGGDSSTLSQYATINYTKHTRPGILIAGAELGRSKTETSGDTAIVNESHDAISVPGSFLLNEPQQVDSISIQVFLKSPLPPNEVILLQENLHYTIIPEANTFRINIVSLPPQFVVPDTYNFFVTYSLFTGNFKLRTDTLSYHVSLDLFNTLQPYHTYTTTRPEILAGNLPGFAFDSTLWIAGLLFHKGGFNVLGEYQKLDWDISPYRAYRLEARYSGALTTTLSFNTAAEYLNRYYPLGSASADDQAFTDERATFSGRIQKSFFAQSLRLSLGGSYARYDALTQGSAYSINSSLSWRISKLDFTLGATAYQSDAEGIIGLTQHRMHQYYFLNVGRKLF